MAFARRRCGGRARCRSPCDVQLRARAGHLDASRAPARRRPPARSYCAPRVTVRDRLWRCAETRLAMRDLHRARAAGTESDRLGGTDSRQAASQAPASDDTERRCPSPSTPSLWMGPARADSPPTNPFLFACARWRALPCNAALPRATLRRARRRERCQERLPSACDTGWVGWQPRRSMREVPYGWRESPTATPMAGGRDGVATRPKTGANLRASHAIGNRFL